jgi:NAD(P)-dependent dehydrogenase (short-subunit alcohol dehydrogenase family)
MPVYVVTGARTGIGLEYVRQISRSQANTVFALVCSLTGDLSARHAIWQSSPGRIRILECDISSSSSIAALPNLILSTTPDPEETLTINFLINNAAILHARAETALTLSPAALLFHITTNVLGPSQLLQALLPLLAPDAVVANISSGIGSLAMVGDGRIDAEITPYSISKVALNMLTVHQARQLKAMGSRVVVVAVDPGHVKTEMGGPQAVVEVVDSASGVLKVLHGLREGDGGRFLLYTGERLEW